MTALNLTPSEIDALVRFMEVGLTDPRVAWEQAPFDHPSLTLAQGEVGDENSVVVRPVDAKSTTPRAKDVEILLNAIGATGRRPSDGPLMPFASDLQ
jgi:hypothetical protein